MTAGYARVSVIPGNAIVARVGDAVLVADPSTEAQEAFVETLIGLCEGSVASDDAADTIRRIGSLVLEHTAAPAFGVLVATRSGAVAILAGDARLSVVAAGGDSLELEGRAAVTYVDRMLAPGFVTARLSVRAEDAAADRFSDLTGGIVRGDGVVVSGATTTAQPDGVDSSAQDEGQALAAADVGMVNVPVDATSDDGLAAGPVVSTDVPDDDQAGSEAGDDGVSDAEDPDTAFTPIDLFDSDPADEQAEPQVSPLDADLAPGQPAAVMVDGIVCSRGHFTRPGGKFCDRCGISLVQQTHDLVTGQRPPLGVLVVDDGSVFTLGGDYVLGREPEVAEQVTSGAAAPLRLDDSGLALSRVHAHVILDGWEVRFVDAGSANGTFVLPPGASEWLRLEPAVPTTVSAGTRIAMGGRLLTFESHQRS